MRRTPMGGAMLMASLMMAGSHPFNEVFMPEDRQLRKLFKPVPPKPEPTAQDLDNIMQAKTRQWRKAAAREANRERSQKGSK